MLHLSTILLNIHKVSKNDMAVSKYKIFKIPTELKKTLEDHKNRTGESESTAIRTALRQYFKLP